MQSDDEAKILLGFSPNSLPTPSQVKSAYRRKVWETHPDRFPPHLKAEAESNFKLISEAYSFLNSPGGSRSKRAPTASYSRVVVRTGVGSPNGGGMRVGASAPFLFIICGALGLAGSTAYRAYGRQKEAHPSFNPFLP
ncbi:Chaperone DnaJ-domain superfamily protein [Perilla frutescens var. hirtella]|uniref:Chaperone DnaJ-domain superfamily protein n=1 Tax=Perilla frutescens var. hirtella TaxID=608512 RepID=A0AAD4J269_PERFH|nr:Chaperone DnaJ-domain superfamily protein [Perilla frutescens var. hirtella]